MNSYLVYFRGPHSFTHCVRRSAIELSPEVSNSGSELLLDRSADRRLFAVSALM